MDAHLHIKSGRSESERISGNRGFYRLDVIRSSMYEDSDVDRTLDCIRVAIQEMESMAGAEAEKRMMELFDRIVSQYADHAGMQALMLSTALGDIRHMESSDGDRLFGIWQGWVNECGLEPEQVPREKVREASKRIFGSEDAFIYRRRHPNSDEEGCRRRRVFRLGRLYSV